MQLAEVIGLALAFGRQIHNLWKCYANLIQIVHVDCSSQYTQIIFEFSKSCNFLIFFTIEP